MIQGKLSLQTVSLSCIEPAYEILDQSDKLYGSFDSFHHTTLML